MNPLKLSNQDTGKIDETIDEGHEGNSNEFERAMTTFR